MSQPELSKKTQYPRSGYAWFVVGILTVAYILSYIDRAILGFLAEPIKADLGLSDTQMGLLSGFAFAIFYATMGLPIGYLADRTRRTWIIGIGVGIWSLATAASGLAKNFTHLFVARMTVGVGEASLGPCAMSMISDSFPPERRGKPIAVYTAALSVGGGIASLVSAWVLDFAKSAPDISLPFLGPVAPWQFTFILVGLPGILVALVFMLMREPARLAPVENDRANQKIVATTVAAMIVLAVNLSLWIWVTSPDAEGATVMGAINAKAFAGIVSLVSLVAAVFLLMNTMKNKRAAAQEGIVDDASLGFAARYVGSHFAVYGSLLAFVCLMTIVAYSQFWYTPMFSRTWGWEAQTYAFYNGVVLLAFGPISVISAGFLNDWLFARGFKEAPLLILMFGACLIVPTAIAAPLMPSAPLAMAVIALNTVGIAITSATGVTALLNITPAQIKGQVVALYYMTISMAGLLIGPSLVGVLSDEYFGNDDLRYAVATLPVIFGVPILALIPFARRRYLREVDQIAAQTETE